MSKLSDFKGWETVRTALVASFIAMLIWVWAEGESVSRERIPLIVSLDADPRSEYMYRSEDEAWKGAVAIEVEGTASAIAEAQTLRGTELRLYAGLDGMPTESGAARVARLSEAIRSHPDLRQLEVVIVSVDPPDVTVEVLKMVQRELPLKVELARTLVIDGEPAASPSTVTIRLPDTLASQLVEGSQPIAFVSEDELDRVRGEGARTVNGIVRLPSSLGQVDSSLVDIRPESVSVLLRIRRDVDSFKLPAVPVWFSLPPTEDSGRWNIEVLDKFVSEVTVTGPADQISRIRGREATIKALVELTTDDLNKATQADTGRAPIAGDPASAAAAPGRASLESGEITRPVIFLGLPTGVAATAANPIVRIRVTKVSKSAAAEDTAP